MNRIFSDVITNIINEFNVFKIFDNKIMDSINKSFGARFGTGILLDKVLSRI